MEIPAAALLTAILWLVLRRYPAASARIAARFKASAGKAPLYILAAMLIPITLRLAVLPWLPPPEPSVHDEFSHLLVADTLAAGRLANPPHPLWRHLETIYVLQQPTYSSTYPIGQGAILAVGKLLTGNPWTGVLLSVALMSGAVSWMLFGCLPSNWAAAGGLLAAVAYGLNPLWVNSYWGGAFCAFGGALLFGALCRLRRSPSYTMALVAGFGWSIVWLIRPFESLLPLMITWGLIGALIIRDLKLWKRWRGPIVVILSMHLLVGCVTALHNRAVTGSFTTLPYQLSQRVYGVPQGFLFQKPVDRPALRFNDLNQVYSWQRKMRDLHRREFLRHWATVLYGAWHFYITPWYTLPILLLVFKPRDRLVLFACGTIACALACSSMYPFFFPHYVAVYACVISFLILRGMMVLYQWSSRGKLVGPLVVLFLVSGGVMTGLRVIPGEVILGASHQLRQPTLRVQVANRLASLGGRHVVFIRYEPGHDFQDEWVYNAANVDASSIVWCRTIAPPDDKEVMRYYKGRHFWVADVGNNEVRVSRFELGRPLSVPTDASEAHSESWVLERPR